MVWFPPLFICPFNYAVTNITKETFCVKLSFHLSKFPELDFWVRRYECFCNFGTIFPRFFPQTANLSFLSIAKSVMCVSGHLGELSGR